MYEITEKYIKDNVDVVVEVVVLEVILFLKACNHLSGQFLNMLIYITNKTYTPNDKI